MIHDILLGLGLVAVIEGLALALAPSRLEDIIRYISDIPVETRLWIGLGFAVFGVFLVWTAKSLI
ncbi:MAG: DUF2065 domain-containing protein [Pseudomonadota bacterium]